MSTVPDLLKSRRITSPLLPQTRRLLEEVRLNEICRKPGELLRESSLSAGKHLIEWLKPAVSLTVFPYIYPISGITDGLNYWIHQERREIFILEGEYGWLQKLTPVQVVKSISEIPDDGVLYVSNPFAASGNYLDHWEEIISSKFKVVLDCAYLGTTSNSLTIPISSQVEVVFFSFSKMLGLNTLGIGYCFSREPIRGLSTLMQEGYLKSIIPEVTQQIIDQFSLNYVYDLLSPLQKKACEMLHLNPSDCCLIGTSFDSKYNAWKRSNGINRICLSPIFEKELFS